MAETKGAAAQPDQARDQPQRSLSCQPQQQRVLAHESELIQSPPPAPSPPRGSLSAV